MDEKIIVSQAEYSKEGTPIPVCVVTSDGKIAWANDRIKEVFLYGDIVEADIFALTSLYYNDFVAKKNREEKIEIKISAKTFKVLVEKLDENAEENQEEKIRLFFIEITSEIEAREDLLKTQPSILRIQIDNYEEIVGKNRRGLEIAGIIDTAVRDYSKKINAVVAKHAVNMYLLTVERQYIEDERREGFPILQEIKKINIEEDFPVTLSIGIGLGKEGLLEIERYADEALDLALGRGGDQVVVKQRDEIAYYGGQNESIGTRNKGKSRIIALALKSLVESAGNVIIMGHRYPDMDSFGAALGIHRLARPLKKETYILMDTYNESLNALYKKAKNSEQYKFINKEKAMTIVKKSTLLIIVDVNRPSFTDCPELLDKIEKVVVIDHHRKGEDFIMNPTVAYTEPSASSASELVAEILEYCGEEILKLEAEALMAGIFMDTNRFSVKTGSRTLSIAKWLKEKGADLTVVKGYFQISYEMFKAKAVCTANAQITEDKIATSICEGFTQDANIINSQVADELLTIDGVKASFVAGKDHKGETMVSARSLGEINVQTVMEVFGGGGHLTTAGMQTDKAPAEIIDDILAYISKL